MNNPTPAPAAAPAQAVTLDAFTRAYIECALWSSTDHADDSGGEPLDANYDASDIAPAALASIIEDCTAFQRDNDVKLGIVESLCESARAGHNFWLNRNGHGSGFWDEYFGPGLAIRDAFMRLSDASKAYGSCDLYVGDDGQLYL